MDLIQNVYALPEKIKQSHNIYLFHEINDFKPYLTSKLINQKIPIEIKSKKYFSHFLHDFYDNNSIPHMIINDDITEFQNYIRNCDKNANELSFDYCYPFNYFYFKSNYDTSSTIESINFAAFFGSIKTFKFILWKTKTSHLMNVLKLLFNITDMKSQISFYFIINATKFQVVSHYIMLTMNLFYIQSSTLKR